MEHSYGGRAIQAFDWTAILAVCLLGGLVCSLFAALGSWATAAWLLMGAFTEEEGYLGRLLIKAVGFSLVTLGGGLALRRVLRGVSRETVPGNLDDAPSPAVYIVVALTVLLTLALVFPNLSTYPWTAPDELHHLIVAKNLAEQNAYASGHHDSAFVYFDNYDSVGPPVIASVAFGFKLLGVQLTTARVVIGVSYLLLCLLAFVFLRPVIGLTGAAFSVLMLLTTFGTVYLARSVYGEVPAFGFFLAGLLFWRHSLNSEKTYGGGAVLAGVFFGLAALTKAILLIAACAFAVVWLFDRMTHRRVSIQNVFLCCVGAVSVFGCWLAYKWQYREFVAEGAPSIIYYRHYLVFGFDSVLKGARWFLERPGTTMFTALALATAAPIVFWRRYDPALMVLGLTGVLFFFWWLFFTPGTIPRYLWFSFAATALLSGAMLGLLKEAANRIPEGVPRYAVSFVALAILLAPSVSRTSEQFGLVYGADEMLDDRAAIEFVRALPPGATVATTFWPLERSTIFFADRTIDIVEDVSPDHEYVIAYKDASLGHGAPSASITHIENYVVLHQDLGG